MQRKQAVLEVQILKQKLILQRLEARSASRRPLAMVRRFSGWPVVLTGLASGLVVGSMRVHVVLARALSAGMLALRIDRVGSLIMRRL